MCSLRADYEEDKVNGESLGRTSTSGRRGPGVRKLSARVALRDFAQAVSPKLSLPAPRARSRQPVRHPFISAP